jgi:exonuclease III
MSGRLVGDVNICHNDADLHKGLVFAEQAKLHEIVDTRLFEIRQVFCVVDMSLRVEVPVADFGWVEEVVSRSVMEGIIVW